MILVQKINGTS